MRTREDKQRQQKTEVAIVSKEKPTEIESKRCLTYNIPSTVRLQGQKHIVFDIK